MSSKRTESNGLAPIWLEGIITSEFEQDTLPLLFADELSFSDYYDDLIRRHQDLEPGLKRLRLRNIDARQLHTNGLFQGCLETLADCVFLRQCLFGESHMQFTAAVHHLLLSVLHFAAFSLREGYTRPDRREQEGYLSQALEMLTKAKHLTECLPTGPDHVPFFKSIVCSSLATYFWRRKRPHAAAQHAAIAFRSFAKTKIPTFAYYFHILFASALLVSERFEPARGAMQLALALLPDTGSVPGTAAPGTSLSGETFSMGLNKPIKKKPKRHSEDDFADDSSESERRKEDEHEVVPPLVSFAPQILSSALPLLAATSIVAYYNMALIQVGLHRITDASLWCARCMDVAAVHRSYLKVGHPWVDSIRHLQEFCAKATYESGFGRFKMPRSATRIPEFEMMQKLISDARNIEEIISSFNQMQTMASTATREPKSQCKSPPEAVNDNDQEPSTSTKKQPPSLVPKPPSDQPREVSGASNKPRRPKRPLKDVGPIQVYTGTISHRFLRECASAGSTQSRPSSGKRPDSTKKQ